jgi:hypothetical protein
MQIGAGQGAAHDGADGTAVVESPPRCAQADEHLTYGAWRPGIVQVTAEGFADVPRQGQSLDTASFAVDEQLPGVPIQVLQAQGGHLPGAQAQTGQEQHNGVIAPALRTILIDGLQQTLDVLAGHKLWQAR